MKEEVERKIRDTIIGALAKPHPSRPSDDDIKRAVRTVFDAYEVEVIPPEIAVIPDASDRTLVHVVFPSKPRKDHP